MYLPVVFPVFPFQDQAGRIGRYLAYDGEVIFSLPARKEYLVFDKGIGVCVSVPAQGAFSVDDQRADVPPCIRMYGLPAGGYRSP